MTRSLEPGPGSGLGLVSMRERAESVGGVIRVLLVDDQERPQFGFEIMPVVDGIEATRELVVVFAFDHDLVTPGSGPA